MFSFFKNAKMPSPPEEMEAKHLVQYEISLNSEIISGAYEPRFDLTALGTANGYLYIINTNDQICRSPKSVNYPLLKIISLPNASSFFSICGKTMYKRHTSNFQKPNPYNLEMLKDVKSSKIDNICTQWIIKPDRILSRTVQLDFDVIDVAISPVHPEFALMLTVEGSLYGFSIESLNFTNLYVNIFENKPVKSICWSSGYKFLIAHDTVDGLDVKKLELVSQYNTKAQTVDSIDQWTTTIDEKGVPNLLMFMSCVASIDVPQGSKAVFSGMLNGPNWLSIIRSRGGDVVYENKKEKFNLHGEFAVPTTFIKYQKPFQRASPKEIAISTDFGRFIYLDGKVKDHFFFDPPNAKFALEDGDDIYVFAPRKERKSTETDDDDDDEKDQGNASSEIVNYQVYQFRKGSFYNYFKISSLKISSNPLGINKGKVIFVENAGDVRVYDIQSQKKTDLQKLNSIKKIRHSKVGYADLICNDGSVFRIMPSDDGFELTELEDKSPNPQDIIDWRPFRGTYVGINKYKQLVYKSCKKKICESIEDRILFFDVVNYIGKEPVENEEEYIVIVTIDRILVYSYDTKEKKLHKVRKLKQTYIVNATISEWGTLIIQTETQILMLPLPDISAGPIDKIQISKDGRAALVPKHGAIIFEPNSVSFYLDNFQKPKLYDPKEPEIERPKVNKLLQLFGKKEDTIKEADKAFQYRRSTNLNDAMNQTKEAVQQLLVKAAERGEQINEMEIKSNKILSSARNFHKMARELKNKHFWL